MQAFGGEYIAPGVEDLSRRSARQARPGERYAERALSRHAARFARRQRLRAALRRHLRHPRPAGSGRRRRGGCGGDGARDRPHHRQARRPARRARAPGQAVQPHFLGIAGAPDEGEEYEARTKLTLARFSREQEFEADRIGIRTVRQGGLRPLRRRALPRQARPLERAARRRLGVRAIKPGHDGDASLDARAHRRGGRAGQADRRQGHRRRRARLLPLRDRRPRLRRQSGAGPGDRDAVRASEARLRFPRPRGLRAGKPELGADRRRRGRRAGAAARQHRGAKLARRSNRRSPPAGSTACRPIRSRR